MRFVLFPFMCLGLFACAGSAPPVCQALKDYDMLTQGVTREFYDPTFKGLDWRERVAHYRATLTCVDREPQVAAKIRPLLKELHTSHTGVFTPEDLDYWAIKSIFANDLSAFRVLWPGIWPEGREDGWYVSYVLPGSAASAKGFGAGDRLLSLDGEPFRPLGYGPRTTLTYVHAGRTQELVLKSEPLSLQESFLRASEKSERVFRVRGQKIGYFHLWCGTHERFLQAQNLALTHFAKAHVSGLILDYRDGFGGANPEYLKLVAEDPHLAKVKKVFLINGRVRSGKEWLAAIVRRDKLGTLVGTKTSGMFMGGGPVDLPDERYFMYLAKREFNPPDIPKIEGVGVAPDIVVEPCTKDCGDHDPQLDRALSLFP